MRSVWRLSECVLDMRHPCRLWIHVLKLLSPRYQRYPASAGRPLANVERATTVHLAKRCVVRYVLW